MQFITIDGCNLTKKKEDEEEEEEHDQHSQQHMNYLCGKDVIAVHLQQRTCTSTWFKNSIEKKIQGLNNICK